MSRSTECVRGLVGALPYIKEFRGTTMVVKIGGASLEDSSLCDCFAQDLVLLHWVGIRVVVVHGGGKQISEMLAKMGLEPRFIDGQRVTDAAALDVVEMVLSGSLNPEIVRLVDRWGGKAVGITGKDGGMVVAKRRSGAPDLGFVGDVEEVHIDVLEHLMDAFVPVVAPLALSERGQTLNVNADPFASALAVALGASKFVLLSDVEGVRGATGELITTLSEARARQLISAGTIGGGMIPKVENALAAVEGGVAKVHIIDGRVEHVLLLEVFTQVGVGTQILREDECE